MDKQHDVSESFSLTAGDRIAADDYLADDESFPFYEGGQRRYLIEQAVHHLHFDTATILILGESGSGKTTVLEQLLDELQESVDGCLLDAEELDDATLLAEVVAGLDLEDVEYTAESVAEAACARSQSIDLPLLVTLDNAELLSVEQIAALFEVVRLSEGSVRLLLCGDVSLQAKVERIAQGDALLTLQVPPLTRVEVGEYLQFIARRQGRVARLSWTTEMLQKAHQATHGNIALINAYAEQLFVAKPKVSGLSWRDMAQLPVRHLMVGAGLVVLILLLLVVGGDKKPTDTGLNSVEVGDQSSVVSQSDLSAGVVTKPLALPEAVAGKENNLPALPPPSTPSTQVTADGVSTILEPSIEAGPAVPAVVDSGVNSNPVVSSPSVSAQNEPVETAVAPVATATVVTPKVEVSVPKVESAVKSEKASVKSVSSSAGRGEKQLLAMSASSFVLQVFASHDKAKVEHFVSQYAAKVKITYFETRHQGKPWFVVVLMDSHRSAEKAKASIASLPQGLRTQKPWPRSVASIQKDIRALR